MILELALLSNNTYKNHLLVIDYLITNLND